MMALLFTGGALLFGQLTPMTRPEIIAVAQPAMGYSYWWGGGCWQSDGACPGVCSTNSGSGCPSCTHSASAGCSAEYGADCSGLMNKVWGLPNSGTSVSDCVHGPYATASYVGSSPYFNPQSRAAMQAGDAFAYNSNGAGHIFLFEAYDGGNDWGWAYAYECKGCVDGCVHDLRSVSSVYNGLQRTNVIEDDGGTDAGAAEDAGADAGAAVDAGSEVGADAGVDAGSTPAGGSDAGIAQDAGSKPTGPAPKVTDVPPGGCGCGTPGRWPPAADGLWLAVLGCLLWRRRG